MLRKLKYGPSSFHFCIDVVPTPRKALQHEGMYNMTLLLQGGFNYFLSHTLKLSSTKQSECVVLLEVLLNL